MTDDQRAAEHATGRRLPADALRTRCDPEALGFETTDELPVLEAPPRQERALSALRLGVDMPRGDYNVFALGSEGLGKHAAIETVIAAIAAEGPPPDDWCYVHNFVESDRPLALRLPTGRGRAFKDCIDELLRDLRAAIPAAFQSGDFQTRKEAIERALKERRDAAFGALQEEARERDMGILQSPMGFLITAIREGKPVDPRTIDKWPERDKERLVRNSEELERRLHDLLEEFPKWEQEAIKAVRDAAKQVTRLAVTHLVNEARDRFADIPAVVSYIDAFREDVIRNANAFLELHAESSKAGLSDESVEFPTFFTRYKVNLFVANDAGKGKPLVYEDNPTFQNVIGAIEYRAQFGNLVTDFTLMKPGALHRANGGYLILRARSLLSQPFAYDALKRSLRAGRVKLQSLGQLLSLTSAASLEPEPIPVDVKVVLIGDRVLYYLLSALDPEFDQLFKIAADFDEDVDRTPENTALTARLLAAIVRREHLRPLDKYAAARVLEESARLSGASDRLSVRRQELTELLCEADREARLDGRQVIQAGDVDRAQKAQIHRLDRARERLTDAIRKGEIMLSVDGERIGQTSGLAVATLGRFTFARPVRITATARAGDGDVVNIDREAELSGPVHVKAVLTLQRYLASRYALDIPLALSAALVFEQSYGVVEGDSASAAELFALLSAIAQVPLDQSIAVTGSVNQHGDLQAVGGVNEKIEGFFDACAALGLTGRQGVIIPAANTRHLMLREDVVAAVAEGRFHVYAVSTIDEGLAMLTGTPPGERDAEGNFPPESFNGKVEDRLAAFAEAVRRIATPIAIIEAEGGDEDVS
jgi:lon-related putative ATP-dependent protease